MEGWVITIVGVVILVMAASTLVLLNLRASTRHPAASDPATSDRLAWMAWAQPLWWPMTPLGLMFSVEPVFPEQPVFPEEPVFPEDPAASSARACPYCGESGAAGPMLICAHCSASLGAQPPRPRRPPTMDPTAG